MKRCSKCNNLMPDDALHCIRCGNESPSTVGQKLNSSTEANPVSGDDPQSPRRINWTRVFAAVLTSKLFFLTSCTGGMVLSHFAFDGVESGVHGNQVRALDNRMSVIAVIPSADKPGERKVVYVPLFSLERFKQDNPDYSFVPPLGKGEVNGPSVLTRTEYTVTTAGPGKVMVETKFHDDEHHVLARYAATDKEIKPFYTKTNHDFIEFMIGMFVGSSLALVLALVGYIFKWRLRRMEGVTGTASQLFGIGRLGRLTALTCMWFFIAFTVAIVLSKLV